MLVISRFVCSSWWLARNCLVDTSPISLTGCRSVVWARSLANQRWRLYFRSSQRQKEVAGWPRTSRCFYVAITAGNLRAVFPNYRSRYSCVFCSFARNIQSLKKATLIGFLTAIRVLVWPSTFYASLYKLALESQYIPLSKKLGDRRFFSHFHLSSHILQYYFMSLSEYQMHFQDCPPASRQSKLFCTVM